jgi:hypothetical protein
MRRGKKEEEERKKERKKERKERGRPGKLLFLSFQKTPIT